MAHDFKNCDNYSLVTVKYTLEVIVVFECKRRKQSEREQCNSNQFGDEKNRRVDLIEQRQCTRVCVDALSARLGTLSHLRRKI